jgi:hypothetical protein
MCALLDTGASERPSQNGYWHSRIVETEKKMSSTKNPELGRRLISPQPKAP